VYWSLFDDYFDEVGFWFLIWVEDLCCVSLDWEMFFLYVGGIMVFDDFGILFEG